MIWHFLVWPGKAGQVGSGKARCVAFFLGLGKARQVRQGLDRHGALRRDKARQVWIGSGRYGGAMQGPDRFGKARPGKAGWAGCG